MIKEEDIAKHISTQGHQMRKKALECNLTTMKGEEDKVVLREQSQPQVTHGNNEDTNTNWDIQ